MKDEVHAELAASRRKKAQPEVIIVKKYANRRLYNTALSSYITLEDLAAMVRSGQDFVVQDAKTGADLTRSVLTQIIFEQEGRDGPLLPVNFLRQLIRMYGDALQGYVPSYLEMTMAAFERHQETFRDQLKRSFGPAAGYAQMEAMARANMEIFNKAIGMFSPFAARQADFSDAPAETTETRAEMVVRPEATAESEIADLRAQLAEMQRTLDKMLTAPGRET